MSAQNNTKSSSSAQKAHSGRAPATIKPYRAKKRSKVSLDLSPEAQAYEAALRECNPQERIFVQERVLGATLADAIRAAGYKPKNDKNADAHGRQLIQRLRVKNALEAGFAVYTFSIRDLLEDIDELRLFDRSQIEREIKVVETTILERPAEEVVQELLKRERMLEEMLVAKREEDPEGPVAAVLTRRLAQLLLRRLELEESLLINPQAVAFEPLEQVVTKRVIDYDLARERGLLKYIKKVRVTKYGDEIETYDWLEGLDRAAKAKGLYKDSHEVTGKDGEPLQNGQATVFVIPSNGRDD